jgi:hypothetical protein
MSRLLMALCVCFAIGIPMVVLGFLYGYSISIDRRRIRRLAWVRRNGRFRNWSVIATRMNQCKSTLVFVLGFEKSCELWWTEADIARAYESLSGCRIDDDAGLEGGFSAWVRDLAYSPVRTIELFRTTPPVDAGCSLDKFRAYVNRISEGRTRVIDAWGIFPRTDSAREGRAICQ